MKDMREVSNKTRAMLDGLGLDHAYIIRLADEGMDPDDTDRVESAYPMESTHFLNRLYLRDSLKC